MILNGIDMASNSPILYEPLAMVDPSGDNLMVSGTYGESPVRGLDHSKWVNHKYQGFWKLVGFPIGSHVK